MKKVFLINPPGGKPYLRDYYCSKVSKAGYLYHPVDLTFQSAVLRNRHRVGVIDAIAEKTGTESLLKKIAKEPPDAVLCLLSAVAWEEDRSFVRELRKRYRGLIAGTGDVFLEDPSDTLKELPELDAALLDFTSPGFSDWVENPEEVAVDMVVRRGDDITAGERSPKNGEFSIGMPQYDLFPANRYRYPFVRRKPFATVLTDFGCPYPCSFCIMNKIGYRTRPLDEVIEELKWLKNAGYRELYINDQTFGASKNRAFKLLDMMRQAELDFGWVCFTRTDILDHEMALAIKSAGCHTVMFGVESADRGILETYKKGTGPEAAFKAREVCEKLNLRTVATFLIGFPEDTDETVEATVNLALQLDPDYASFNFAVPRRGTGLRKKELDMELADSDSYSMDQSGDNIAMPTKSLSTEELAEWKKKALSKFYLRPGYVIKRMLNLKTTYEISTSILGGMKVLGNVILKNGS